MAKRSRTRAKYVYLRVRVRRDETRDQKRRGRSTPMIDRHLGKLRQSREGSRDDVKSASLENHRPKDSEERVAGRVGR